MCAQIDLPKLARAPSESWIIGLSIIYCPGCNATQPPHRTVIDRGKLCVFCIAKMLHTQLLMLHVKVRYPSGGKRGHPWLPIRDAPVGPVTHPHPTS